MLPASEEKMTYLRAAQRHNPQMLTLHQLVSIAKRGLETGPTLMRGGDRSQGQNTELRRPKSTDHIAGVQPAGSIVVSAVSLLCRIYLNNNLKTHTPGLQGKPISNKEFETFQ